MQTVNRFVFMGMFILSALFYLTAMIFGIVETIGSFAYFGGGVGVIIVLVLSYLLLTLALIGFIVSLATGIASIIRSFRDKEHHVNAKPLMFMTMFAVPFMAFYNFCFGGAYMGILLYSFCNIFLITTISLTTLALAAHKVLSGEMKVKPILANAFAGLAFMFVAMIVIFGIMPSGSWLYGIPFIDLFCLIASIFGLAALILLLIALPKPLKRERGIKGSVILLSISAGLNVFAFVFMIIAGGLVVSLVPFILMWVFFVFALALLIVSSKLDPKKPANRPAPRQYQPYPQQGYPQPQQGYPQYQQQPQPQGYPQYQQPQPQPQHPQNPQDPNNPYRY
ncbi:MAG: hypothetical protein J6T25_00020 [Bacilli bacterium]|nr:hypothetical protein [Bacilli bacterium]